MGKTSARRAKTLRIVKISYSSCLVKSWFKPGDGGRGCSYIVEWYRYMNLKTYTKFTFCIKSQDTFLMKTFCITVCTNLAKFLFNFFSICTSKHTWTFSVIFSKWFYTQSSEAALLFIALNCVTSAAFIANLCSHLIPVHYKNSTTCSSKRTF